MCHGFLVNIFTKSLHRGGVLNKVQIQILKKGFTNFELIQVIRMMDCQFEAVIHGKDGLGCWAIEGKVIIHKSQCEVSLVGQDTNVCVFLAYIFNQAIVSLTSTMWLFCCR